MGEEAAVDGAGITGGWEVSGSELEAMGGDGRGKVRVWGAGRSGGELLVVGGWWMVGGGWWLVDGGWCSGTWWCVCHGGWHACCKGRVSVCG
jgi:hypothetical protein